MNNLDKRNLDKIIISNSVRTLHKFLCENIKLKETKENIHYILDAAFYEYKSMAIAKYILINYKYVMTKDVVNDILRRSSIPNKNIDIILCILTNYRYKLTSYSIIVAFKQAVYHNNIRVIKSLLYNYDNIITDKNIGHFLKTTTFTNPDIIMDVKICYFIKTNKLCPAKYKNTIFLS